MAPRTPEEQSVASVSFITALCFLVTGLSLGFVVGLSESPAAALSVQALIGIPAAAFGYLYGLKRSTTESGVRLQSGGALVAAVALGFACGVPPGVYVRSHSLLGSETTSNVVLCKAKWPADFCAEMMMQDVLYDRLGIPEASQEAWRRTLEECSWSTTVVGSPDQGLALPSVLVTAKESSATTLTSTRTPSCFSGETVAQLRSGSVQMLEAAAAHERAVGGGVGAKSGE